MRTRARRTPEGGRKKFLEGKGGRMLLEGRNTLGGGGEACC